MSLEEVQVFTNSTPQNYDITGLYRRCSIGDIQGSVHCLGDRGFWDGLSDEVILYLVVVVSIRLFIKVEKKGV